MAGVTPRNIYDELIATGASTVQAIGIMANMINESGLNPEAVGDQGTSFGLVQFHEPGYAGASSLVTGNPAADMRAQVRYLAQVGGFRAASGATPAEAAGNFAANFERCTECAPGGAQYNGRVANAAKVSGWVSSGSWPTSAGSGGGGGAIGAPLTSAGDPTLGGTCVGTTFPHTSWCLKKTAARHLVGGVLMAAGALVALPGVFVLVAFAFKASGAQKAASQVVGTVVPAAREGRAFGRYMRGDSGEQQASRKRVSGKDGASSKTGSAKPTSSAPRLTRSRAGSTRSTPAARAA